MLAADALDFAARDSESFFGVGILVDTPGVADGMAARALVLLNEGVEAASTGATGEVEGEAGAWFCARREEEGRAGSTAIGGTLDTSAAACAMAAVSAARDG